MMQVRCQSLGHSSLQVLRGLLSQEGGLGVAFLQRLYAGVTGAAMCSVVIGAIHFAVRGRSIEVQAWPHGACRRVVQAWPHGLDGGEWSRPGLMAWMEASGPGLASWPGWRRAAGLTSARSLDPILSGVRGGAQDDAGKGRSTEERQM
jgi:hypothetical protein